MQRLFLAVKALFALSTNCSLTPLRIQPPQIMAILAFMAISLSGCSGPHQSVQPATRVLVFSKTAAFRHDSIPNGISAIQQLGANNHFAVDASEDASIFTDQDLAKYQAIIFLSTSGEILDDHQKGAFQRYIQGGHGFVGIHSASDTERNWPWYGGLVGAVLQSHPLIQPGSINVTDTTNPSTSFLPMSWGRTDEWYNFGANPRGSVHVLATLDETTYSGGTMGADHPIAWCHEYQGGRAWYTAGGHTQGSYSEPLYVMHILGGIEYAAGLATADCG